MSWKTRLLLRESAFTAIAFTLSSYAISFMIRGMREFLVPGPMRDYMTSSAIHVEILVTGVVFGGLIGVVSRLSETPRMRALPLGLLVLVRACIYLVGLAVSVVLVVVALHFTLVPFDELRELWAVIELGPPGSGYCMECFPDVWKDAIKAREEIEAIWKRLIRKWK